MFKNSDCFLAAGEQQSGKLAQLPGAEVAYLAAMQVADGWVEPGEEFEAVGGDMDQDSAAIGILAAAPDKSALLESVEETGDVGVAGDHAVRNFAAQQPVGRAAEDAQGVVLIRGEIMLFEQLRRTAGEKVGSALEFDEERFFRAGCWLAVSCLGHSASYDSRCNK
jgi:hypothetical protein